MLDLEKIHLKHILDMSTPRDRAFFCMMAQTGLRPSTIANLKLKDIEPEFSRGFNPCKIDIPEGYFTFMPEETIKHLRTYFMTRGKLEPEDWLFTCQGVDKKLNVKSMAGLFFRAVNKLDLKDLRQKAPGKPRNVRLYCLRKFFRRWASFAGIEYVNFWTGCKTNCETKNIEFHRALYREQVAFNLSLQSN
jgi:integrase